MDPSWDMCPATHWVKLWLGLRPIGGVCDSLGKNLAEAVPISKNPALAQIAKALDGSEFLGRNIKAQPSAVVARQSYNYVYLVHEMK